MPSFVYIRNGQEIDRLVGADPRALENKIIGYLNVTGGNLETIATPEERQFLQKFVSFAERVSSAHQFQIA